MQVVSTCFTDGSVWKILISDVWSYFFASEIEMLFAVLAVKNKALLSVTPVMRK